jgi:hypothetical protein
MSKHQISYKMEYDCHSDIQFGTWHVQRQWQGFWKYITKWIQWMIWGLEGSYGVELVCDKNYFQGDNTDFINEAVFWN